MINVIVDIFGSPARPDLGQDYNREPTVSFSCEVADTTVDTLAGIVGVFGACKWFGIRSEKGWLYLSERGFFCD